MALSSVRIDIIAYEEHPEKRRAEKAEGKTQKAPALKSRRF